MIEILYDALASDLGIIVHTDDVPRLRQKLYAERRKDPALKALAFTPSPTSPGSELWIVKREQPNAEER